MSDAHREERPRVHLGASPGLTIIVVGLAVVAALTAFLWTDGGSELDGLPAATETDEAEPPAAEEESDLEEDSGDLEVVEDLPVVTYEVYLARDPFEPVREPEATDGGAGDQNGSAGDDGGTGTPDDPDSPDDPSAPDPDDPDEPSGDPSCAGSEDERVCDGRVVSLLEVTEQDGELVAEIQVDTTIYTVHKDQVFATQFELESFEGTECVMLTFASETFRLCVGESTLK